ncbi:hypothetical protein [Acidovorax sp. Leaf160]|uniref:hypothetical protein n=1 Tax=Acidovorax sp. Leaf160 TaxID=1736280 RepID=UPI0007022F77|nr:hypothetical protein [Acidovorax sp. Leaf160]KQR55423.1 hypothetical protein ASF94_03040 [Acidovorax sp. Leaf160]
MRRGPCILLLLIVLMTLRGLVGPAMAAGMAMPHAPALQTAAAALLADEGVQHAGHGHGSHGEHDVAAVGAHPDASGGQHCREAASAEASLALPHSADCSGSGAAAHANCADCEICHTAVLVDVPAAAPPPGREADRAPAAATRFASAGAALAIKPPIS